MKKMHCALLTLSTVTMALWLTGPCPVSAQTAGKFEPAQLREDFQIARQALEESNSGLYRYTNKAELDRVFDEAEKSFDHPMDFHEFYRVMMPTIAAIKCGHTTISIPPDVREETERLPWLPFDVRVLDSKPYIFRDYVTGGVLAGKEIQAVNGVPAARIVSTMLAATSKDGDIQSSREREISNNFGGNLITLLELGSPYEVVLTGSGGSKTEKVQVAGLRHQDLIRLSKTLYPQDQPSKDFADLKFLDGGQIAYLTYSQFGTNVEQGRAFMKCAFKAIQSKGSRALILDVRENTGGEGELGELLFSYLVATPFKYYDDIIVNKWKGSFSFTAKYTDPHRDLNVPEGVAEPRADGRDHITLAAEPLLGLQQPSKPTFTGRLYVLMNGGSFSTTAEFLSVLDSHHRATFVGEESGGGYYGNTSGSAARIALPNTRLVIYIPAMDGYVAVLGGHEAARGVIPDFPVKQTITDLVAGVDRDYELALELARNSR
ncbi:MAG TPA: S41 family peptidase [Terriglobia bacterium]|nr:S41 family peptidase [Terriglobia bacterium]